METEELALLVEELDSRLERLRILYDQYFGGIEKTPPSVVQKDVDRRIWILRREKIRNTGVRFRFQQIIQRYNTLTSYWQRVCREIENGTYKRHVARARRRFGTNEPNASVRAPAPAPVAELDVSIDVELEDPQTWLEDDDEAADSSELATLPPPPKPVGDRLPDLLAFATVNVPPVPSIAPVTSAPAKVPAAAATRVTAPHGPVPAATPIRESSPGAFLPGPMPSRAPASPAAAHRPPTPIDGSIPGAGPVMRARLHPLVTALEHRAVAASSGPTSVKVRAAEPAPPDAAPPSAGTPRAPARMTLPSTPLVSNRAPTAQSVNGAPKEAKAATVAPKARDVNVPTADGAPPAPVESHGARPPRQAIERRDEARSEEEYRAVYTKYVESRRRNGEPTTGISYEALSRSLADTAAKLKGRSGGRSVDFDVVVQDGKTMLRPVVR